MRPPEPYFLETKMKKIWAIWVLLTAMAWAQVVGTDQIHTVAPGEDLYTISNGYGLGLDHVAFANKIPMKLALTPGQQLTIPLRRILPRNPPANGMVLNVPERGIFLFRGGSFYKFYPVAVGRPDFKTPRGQYRVIVKEKNPTWVPPAWAGKLAGKPIGPGKDNPLGDRWIGLSATRVGIHGTQSPYSIGDAVSHGCLRMYPEMVRELYELVKVGTPIRIEYETAKLGRDPATGELVLATFPDVYRLKDPKAAAARLLRSAGVVLDKARLAQVASARGLALDMNGQTAAIAASGTQIQVASSVPTAVSSAIQVRLADKLLQPAVPPLEEEGQLWLPAELLGDLGVQVYSDPGARWGAVTRAGQRLEFSDDFESPVVARQFGDRLYFLAPRLFEGFGMSYEWNKPTLRLVP